MISTRTLAVVALAAGAALATACATPTAPAPAHTVDQQYFVPADQNAAADAAACEPGNAPYAYELAQTFTAGRTGTLDQVSLVPNRISGSTPAPLALSIQTVTVDGKPSGTVVGSGTYDGPANVVGLFDMPLSSPAAVVQGTQYALVVAESACTTPPPDHGWTFPGSYGATDHYAGGQAWIRAVGSPSDWRSGVAAGSSLDFFFATWVA